MSSISLPLSSKYQKKKIEANFELKISFKKKLSLIFLKKKIPQTIMGKLFTKIELMEAEDHLDELAERIIYKTNLKKNSKIKGFSYKDRSFVKRLKTKGFSNSEILINLKNKSIFKNIQRFMEYKNNEKIDLIICRHVIEHTYDIKGFLNKIDNLLAENGCVLFEVPDTERQLKNGDCSFIWEEHTFYFTEVSFMNLLLSSGYKIIFKKRYHYSFEDSLIFLIKKTDVCEAVFKQKNLLSDFNKLHQNRRKKVKKFVKYYRKLNYKFILLGAGHLSVTFVHLMNLNNDICMVLDGDPQKKGKYFPGTNHLIKNINKNNSYSKTIFLLGMNPIRIKSFLDNNNFGKDNKYLSIFKGNKFSIDNEYTT